MTATQLPTCVEGLEAALEDLRRRLDLPPLRTPEGARARTAGRIVVEQMYSMKLGELRKALVGLPADLVVYYDSPEYCGPASLDSYRGYYHDLALSVGIPRLTVKELIALLFAADGQTFQGYKGGNYVMGERTDLWASEYGESSGRFIRGVMVCEDRVVLLTGREE